MLQDLRENSQGIIAKIIVGFIIITFALWGVDSLVGLATGSGAPVTVNGVEISEQQILQGMELRRRQVLSQMGENADPTAIDETELRKAVIDSLITETALIHSAQERGMAVSQEFVDQIILATNEFQVDGQFDRNQFDMMLRNAGLTPLTYRDLLRRETLVNQEQRAIVNSAFVAPGELNRLRALDRQSRNVRYTTLSTEQALQQVSVSDEEIDAYYQSNRDRFITEEQVAIAYLSLDVASLAPQIEIEEAALQAAYDALVADFQSEEAREAAHILITEGEGRDDEAALALAQELKGRIDGGESFAELAKEYSDDPGSAENGGSLGMVERDVMVPEFEDALFAAQIGIVTEPVRTDFGYHLIQVSRIDHSQAPSYESARPGLLSELRQQQAEALFVSKVEELADVSFSAADLKEPADVLGLEIKTAAPFGRNGGDSEITSHPRVIEAAFSDDVLVNGHNSAVIELGPEQAVVVRATEHLPVRQLALDDVRDQITAELRQQKATAQVVAEAKRIAGAVQAAEDADVEWLVEKDVQRGAQTLPVEVTQQLFRMPKPADGVPTVSTVELANGGAAVVVLESVADGTLETLEPAETEMLNAFLASRQGQQDYRALVSHRRQAAEVDKL